MGLRERWNEVASDTAGTPAFWSPAATSAGMHRVLAPGGRLLMTVPHVHNIHAEPHDYYRFTEYGIRYVLERSRFEVVSVESVGGLAAHLSTLASSVWLGLCARPRLLRALAMAVNRLIVSLCCALDRRLDRAGKYAIGYVVAAHPSSRELES